MLLELRTGETSWLCVRERFGWTTGIPPGRLACGRFGDGSRELRGEFPEEAAPATARFLELVIFGVAVEVNSVWGREGAVAASGTPAVAGPGAFCCRSFEGAPAASESVAAAGGPSSFAVMMRRGGGTWTKCEAAWQERTEPGVWTLCGAVVGVEMRE